MSGHARLHAWTAPIKQKENMRLWSLHPKYLDRIGLVACWREGLLAQAVLLGKTRGYKNHAQLTRFKEMSCPDMWIGTYLMALYNEAVGRGYNFDLQKIRDWYPEASRMMTVTTGQLEYEADHLYKKLTDRAYGSEQYNLLLSAHENIEPHPLFKIIDGPIEPWEKIK